MTSAVAAGYGLGAATLQVIWWLAGDTAWTQLANFATFWWLVPAVPLVVLAAAGRRWVTAGLLAVPAGILLWSYGGLFVGSAGPAAADAAGLRVVTYNTYVRAPDVSHVAALVADEQPDLLLVQEVGSARAKALKRRLGTRLPHTWFSAPNRPDEPHVGGVGVLSRYPIVAVRPIPGRQRFPRPTAVVTVAVPDPAGDAPRHVQVVPAHLVAPCPTCDGPVVARQAREVGLRRDQTQAILAALDPDVPAIVGGDLNSTRRSDPYRMLTAAGFRDPQIEVGSGLGLTYPAPPPQGQPARPGMPAHTVGIARPVVRLDWVLVRDLVPLSAHVAPSRASDHRPVVVRVTWPRAGGPGS